MFGGEGLAVDNSHLLGFLTHADGPFENAEDVVDEDGSIVLDANQILRGRPRYSHQLS